MAIDELNSVFKEATLDVIKKGPDRNACSIRVEDDLVIVSIPVAPSASAGSTGLVRQLKFPKREVRELFEKLYSE